MAYTIPEGEPEFFISGDTVKWTRSDLTDYPPDTWTLTYEFYNAITSETVTAAQYLATTAYLITIPLATTATFTPGDYKWNARVTDGTEEFTIDFGTFTIKSDVAALGGAALDDRTNTKKVLDALDAMMLGKASKDQMGYTIAGRRLDRLLPSELILWRDKYSRMYQSELVAERIKQGKSSGRKVLVRFK